MSESGSFTPSQVMSSSHSSSEGSSIGGFVVVDNCNGHLPNSDSYEDGKSSEIPAKSENLAQAGSTAESQDELLERVQNLSKENEELKGVLHQNSKLLEEYFQDLASMQKNQKQTNESLRKGYDHAKEVVKKLREKNCTLKTELKNEQNKNLQLEEQLSKLKGATSPRHENAAQEVQGNPVQVKSLEEEIKRLESEKDTLELNNSKLQEHISCLKAMREAEQHTENDDCETLISLESLASDIQTSPEELQSENYKKLETEKEILKVDLDKLKIENEQKQQRCNQLEEERDTLLKKLADIEQRQTIDLDEIKPEISDTQASAAASEQVTGLCQQLQVQTEVLNNLKEDLDAVRQENEVLKKNAEDLEKGKATTENNQDIETMKQQLQAYQEKEQENKEAADKQAARQTELMKEIAELKQQLQTYQEKEQENQEVADKQVARQTELMMEIAELKQQLETARGDVGKLREDVNNLTHERDACKRKVEELEMQPEESKGSSDELFGKSGDTPQKDELIAKLKKQIWSYQMREGDLLNRENAVLEMENKHKQLLEGKETLEFQLAEVQKEKNALLEEGRKQEEQAQTLQRQLSSMSDELNETHGQEVNQLKEELQLKDAAMAKVINNAEQLKVNVTKLMETKENLLTECQKLKEDCSQKEEEVESLKKQLSNVSSELNETRECEINQLKEELTKKGEALSTAEMTMESLKVQVTQLIQENQSLAAERERIMDDYTQQENMYQDHLHKITEDSESQRTKRDEIIKTLRKQVTAMEVELSRTRVQLEADSTVHRQLQEEHGKVVTEYEQLLVAYRTSMDENEDHVRNLEKDLRDSDNLSGKLKEDIRIREETIEKTQQELFDVKKEHQEQLEVLKTQMDVYQSDFQVEREAREKQHEQILRLQADNQHYQEEIDQLGNRGIAEMQRRHGSFVPEPRDIQQQQQQLEQARGWFDGLWPMASRGPGDPSEFSNLGNYDQARMGGDQREQVPRADEEDWQCPTCRRMFPDFSSLQMHAVECNAAQAHPAPADVENQCPSCLETFPDYDTLAIHVEECLDQHQGN